MNISPAAAEPPHQVSKRRDTPQKITKKRRPKAVLTMADLSALSDSATVSATNAARFLGVSPCLFHRLYAPLLRSGRVLVRADGKGGRYIVRDLRRVPEMLRAREQGGAQ